MRRQHRVQRAPGELAVADFAPRRRAEAADFTDRIGREVVVQHEALVAEAGQAVDHLLASLVPSVVVQIDWVSPRVNRAEPWVRGRKPTIASIGRTGLGGAAVDALAVLEDGAADDLGLELLDQLRSRPSGPAASASANAALALARASLSAFERADLSVSL